MKRPCKIRIYLVTLKAAEVKTDSGAYIVTLGLKNLGLAVTHMTLESYQWVNGIGTFDDETGELKAYLRELGFIELETNGFQEDERYYD